MGKPMELMIIFTTSSHISIPFVSSSPIFEINSQVRGEDRRRKIEEREEREERGRERREGEREKRREFFHSFFF